MHVESMGYSYRSAGLEEWLREYSRTVDMGSEQGYKGRACDGIGE